MPKTIAKFVLPLLMLSVAIPESEAKRMGGGRSTGRQVQGVRKATPPQAARPAQPQRSQQAQAPAAAPRQSDPDSRVARPQPNPQAPAAPAPSQTLPRQAASPWGGMLGGALLGLGLGSLMSRDGNAQNQPNQQPGSSGGTSGESAGGASGDYDNGSAEQADAANTQTAGGLRSFLLIGLLALVLYFTVRRMRRRQR